MPVLVIDDALGNALTDCLIVGELENKSLAFVSVIVSCQVKYKNFLYLPNFWI